MNITEVLKMCANKFDGVHSLQITEKDDSFFVEVSFINRNEGDFVNEENELEEFVEEYEAFAKYEATKEGLIYVSGIEYC